MNTEELLAERAKTHGEYSEHARCTQSIMRAMMGERNWEGLSDIQKESLHMFAHKMGRIVTGNPNIHDHWDDIAGYARLVSERIPKFEAPPALESTETKAMQSFSRSRVSEVMEDVMRQKFPRQATHAEYEKFGKTMIRSGPMSGRNAIDLYDPEQVKATGRYTMLPEYHGVYDA